MKSRWATEIAFLAVVVLLGGGISLWRHQTLGPSDPEQYVTTRFQVEGMDCGHCETGLDRLLEGVSGVATAEVSWVEAMAEVTYDKRRLTPEELAAEIVRAGYQAKVVDAGLPSEASEQSPGRSRS